MSLVFTDDFERANGAVGNGWTAISGTWTIIGGRLQGTTSNNIRPPVQPAGAGCCVRLHVEPPTSGTKTWTIYARETTDGTGRRFVTFSVSTTGVTCSIGRRVSGSNSTLSSNVWLGEIGASVDLMASFLGDHTYAYAQGYFVVSAYDNYNADNGYLSITTGGTGQLVDSFDLYDVDNDAYLIVPGEADEETGAIPLTIYNGGADWTPGVPGAPEFTVPVGALSDQEILTEDTASAIFTPPSFALPTYLYDPQNDVMIRFDLTSTPTGIGGGGSGGALTSIQAATLSDLATYLEGWNAQASGQTTLELRLGAISLLLNSGYTTGDSTALGALLDTLLAQDGRLATIDAQSYSAMSVASGMSNAGAWTLQNVWQYVQGTGAHTIADVLDAISALPDPSTALQTIVNLLWEIRTVAHSYTLGDVMDAIADLSPQSLQSVLDAIAAVRGNDGRDLTQIWNEIANLEFPDWTQTFADWESYIHRIPEGIVTSLEPVLTAISVAYEGIQSEQEATQAAIAAIPTNPITSLQPVIDDIADLTTLVGDKVALILAAIEALAALLTPKQAPVWPGLANVTFGTPVSLATGLTVSGPMHGVVVNLTYVPPDIQERMFDDQASYYHIGQIAFANDDEALEDFQHFSFGKQMVVPRRMVEASACYVRCLLGITGTVTPWTINAPA